jgi:hypothetical protein
MNDFLVALDLCRALVRRALRAAARVPITAARVVRIELATYELRRVVRRGLEEQRALRGRRPHARALRIVRPHPVARVARSETSPPGGPACPAPLGGARGEA